MGPGLKSAFFYRVCGAGMGAAAALLKARGLRVEGGDWKFYPPMSESLKNWGIPLHDLKEVSEDFLRSFDVVVVGNVVAGESCEAMGLKSLGVPCRSFASLIGQEVLKGREVVGVAGTHGKTTTTYFCVQLFQGLGMDPGYFIGGAIEGGPSAHLGKDDLFFIEADEYDSAFFEKVSKFHFYHMRSMIFTSLEFDHGDIFDSIEKIEDEFRRLISTLSGVLIYDGRYRSMAQLIREVPRGHLQSVVSYAPKILHEGPQGTEFSLVWGPREEVFRFPLVGPHNVANMSSAILLALQMGHTPGDIQRAIAGARLPKRRQEVRGTFRGMPIIDDFAHHPTAIESTIDGVAKRYPNKKIVALFGPESATARSDIFTQDYIRAFRKAFKVLIMAIGRPTSIVGHETLAIEEVREGLLELGVDCVKVGSLDEILFHIRELAHEDKVFLVMSNGPCMGLWQSSFLDDLAP